MLEELGAKLGPSCGQDGSRGALHGDLTEIWGAILDHFLDLGRDRRKNNRNVPVGDVRCSSCLKDGSSWGQEGVKIGQVGLEMAILRPFGEPS